MTYMQGVQDQIDALAADLKKSMKKELQDSGAYFKVHDEVWK